MSTLTIYPTGIFGDGFSEGALGGDAKILRDALAKAKNEAYDTILMKSTNEQGEFCVWNISEWFIDDGVKPWFRVMFPNEFPNLRLIDYDILGQQRINGHLPWFGHEIDIEFPVKILGEKLHELDEDGDIVRTTLNGVKFMTSHWLNYGDGMETTPTIKIIDGVKVAYGKKEVYDSINKVWVGFEECPITFQDGSIVFENLNFRKNGPGTFGRIAGIRELKILDCLFKDMAPETWTGHWPAYAGISPFIWINLLAESQQNNAPPQAFQYTLDPNLATIDENGKPVDYGITLTRRLDQITLKGCKFVSPTPIGFGGDSFKFVNGSTSILIEDCENIDYQMGGFIAVHYLYEEFEGNERVLTKEAKQKKVIFRKNKFISRKDSTTCLTIGKMYESSRGSLSLPMEFNHNEFVQSGNSIMYWGGVVNFFSGGHKDFNFCHNTLRVGSSEIPGGLDPRTVFTCYDIWPAGEDWDTWYMLNGGKEYIQNKLVSYGVNIAIMPDYPALRENVKINHNIVIGGAQIFVESWEGFNKNWSISHNNERKFSPDMMEDEYGNEYYIDIHLSNQTSNSIVQAFPPKNAIGTIIVVDDGQNNIVCSPPLKRRYIPFCCIPFFPRRKK